MKKFLTLILPLMAIALLTPSPAAAQTKIGIVDIDKIVGQLPEFKGIEEQIRSLRQAVDDTLQSIQTNFETRLSTYQAQQGGLTPEARQKEEGELNQLRQKFLAYQQDRLGPQGMLAQMQEKLIEPLRIRVHTAIERVAKDERIGAVLDRSLLAYHDPKLDITFKVLDYLNRGSN